MFRTTAIATAVALCSAALAGPLSPPQGPITSTMKPLDAIEPRVCLNDLPADEGAVVLVTQPGQYFMDADIVAGPGQHGVRIVATGRVSIDLNGFSILGQPGSQNGIDMALTPQSPPSSLHVRCGDGSCRGSISGFGGDGVFTADVREVRCENFDTTDHLGNGLHHLHAEGIIHRDIAARNCGANGTRSACSGRATGKRQHKAITVVSTGNGGDGISIEPTTGLFDVELEDVVCNENGAHGVHIVEPLAPLRDGTETVVVKVQYSEWGLNGGSGFLYELPNGSQSSIAVSDSTSTGNTGDGAAVRVYGPGDAHFGSITIHSRVNYSANGGNGLASDNPLHVEDSVCADNALYGVAGSTGDATTLAMTVDRCVVKANAAGGARCGPGRFAGIANRISDNGGHGLELVDGCLVVSDTTVTNNTGSGISVTDGTLNVKSSSVRRNGEHGIDCGGGAAGVSPIVVLEDVVCELNGALVANTGGANFDGCQSVTLRRCAFNNNTGYGVRCRSSIGPVRWMAPEMILQRNSGNGADLDNITGGVLERCTTAGNGGVGILLGAACTKVRVADCHATDDGAGGIWVTGTGNVIVSCSATANAVGAFNIAPGNASGVVISGAELPQSRDCNANVVW